jgi:hypothetical protein
MGTLLGFIPSIVLKLVSWVAGLFGFDDFKERVDAIDPIDFITKHISAMITKIVDFVKLLFSDPIAAIKELVTGYIDVITDFAGFVYRKAIKPIVDGVEMTLKSFFSTIEKFGMTVIDPQGQPFNPEKHQAMSMQENAELPANTVMAVMQKGYEINGRLLRPAMVLVTRAPESAVDTQA